MAEGAEGAETADRRMRGRLREAVRLFNECAYDEAHEVLEELWLATQGEDSDFFKGLIQGCIAMHHFQDGNGEGARKLYRGHRRYLAAYVPTHREIHVGEFLRSMQESLRSLMRARPSEVVAFEPSERPRLLMDAQD